MTTAAVAVAKRFIRNPPKAARGADHEYFSAGRTRSMKGTRRENAARDQSRPFVRKRRNCMYAAPKATISAKKIRPAREFGVVFGSEIMKKVKRRSAPFSRRCSGIVSGSPSHNERLIRMSDQNAMNAYVTSDRAARFTTRPPRQMMRNEKKATLPH